MSEHICLYKRNGIELVIVKHSSLTEHVEILVSGERVAVIDTLGILQPGDNTRTAYAEIRILNTESLHAEDDDGGTSYLYEVNG